MWCASRWEKVFVTKTFSSRKRRSAVFWIQQKVSTSSAELSHIRVGSILALIKVPLTDNSSHFRSKGFFPQSQMFFLFLFFCFLTKTYFLVMKPRNHVGKRPFWTISGTWVSKNQFLVSSLSLSSVPSTWESTSGSRSSILAWSLKQKTTDPLKMTSQTLETKAVRLYLIFVDLFIFPSSALVVHFTYRQIFIITCFQIYLPISNINKKIHNSQF